MYSRTVHHLNERQLYKQQSPILAVLVGLNARASGRGPLSPFHAKPASPLLVSFAPSKF